MQIRSSKLENIADKTNYPLPLNLLSFVHHQIGLELDSTGMFGTIKKKNITDRVVIKYFLLELSEK